MDGEGLHVRIKPGASSWAERRGMVLMFVVWRKGSGQHTAMARGVSVEQRLVPDRAVRSCRT